MIRPWRYLSLVSIAALSLGGRAAAQQAARDSVRPLSLEDALQLSHPASEAVALARVGVKRATGERTRARSELFPQITGSASYSRLLKSQYQGLFSETPVDTSAAPAPTSCDRFVSDPTRPIGERVEALERSVECATSVNPFGNFGELPFGRANTYNLGLAATQTLFSGGRIRAQIAAANAGRRSATIGVTAAEAQLALDVVQAYYDATLGDRLLAIAEATLAQADTTLTQTRLRREVGTQPEFDLLRAQVARDNQRPIVIQRRTQRDLAYVRLKQLLDLPLELPVQLTTQLDDTSLARVPSLARLGSQAPDTATAHRSSVRQARETVTMQEEQHRIAKAQAFPALTLSSQYGKVAYPAGGLPGWNDFFTNWSVALGLQVPIFTGGKLKGDRIVAAAAVEDARLRLRQTEKAAQLDAKNSLAELESAEATWIASEGTATQARRAYEIAELRFKEGLSAQTELLDARISLEQAEVNRAQAARDLQVARIRLSLLSDLPLATGAQSPAAATSTPARPTPAPAQPAASTQSSTGIPGAP